MSLQLTSITIKTSHLLDMINFYQSLGFKFEVSPVQKGGTLHRAFCQGIELSLYGVNPSSGEKPTTIQFGFKIENLEQVLKKLIQIPGALCILDPTIMPDGKKAIIMDPEGHSVELCEVP